MINGEKVMSIHKMIHLVSINELTEEEILKSIEEGIDTDIKAERGLTPLMAACRWGCMKVVKKLVELGKDVNETSAYGCSSLHYACLGWHPEIIKFLLKNKWFYYNRGVICMKILCLKMKTTTLLSFR